MKKIIEKLEQASAYVHKDEAAEVLVKQALTQAREQQIALEKLKDVVNQAILETPTGIHRNKLIEINILLMELE